MNIKVLITCTALVGSLISGTASAHGHGGYHYDATSGNTYNTYGSTTTGMNANTGSTWTTTHEAGGSMRGVDANGNNWTYNKPFNTYTNFGTGEVRNENAGSQPEE